MTDQVSIIGGVDSHADTIHVAVIGVLGTPIAAAEFPTTADGYCRALSFLNSAEIIRMLKRAIVREIYRLLTQQIEVPSYADLRPARQAKNITLTAVAQHFSVWPAVISRLERGQQRDDDLAEKYRAWLAAA